MSYRHLPRLLCSLLLLGVLVGHVGLVVHAYEHDATGHDDCRLCIAGPAFKATGAVGIVSKLPPAVFPAPLHRPCSLKLAFTRGVFDARAPPVLP